MDEITYRRTLKKLEPEKVRASLMKASLFLAAYELLKGDIIQRTRGFFLDGFKDGREVYSPEYDNDVLSLADHQLEASCKWLVKMKVLTEEQAEEIQTIREHRNAIAHELPKYIIDSNSMVDIQLLERTRYFLKEIGTFWASVFFDADPNKDDISSGTSALIDYIIDIVRASEE